jgi:N-acetyltransferase
MHPMEPVSLTGDLVAIDPLSAAHAGGLLVAADSDEVFTWLPYPRPADLEQTRAWVEDASPIDALIGDFPSPSSTLRMVR